MDDQTPPEISYDQETDVLTICGMEYRAAVFRANAFASIGTYLRIEQRQGSIVVVRGFSPDLTAKFNALAGIK